MAATTTTTTVTTDTNAAAVVTTPAVVADTTAADADAEAPAEDVRYPEAMSTPLGRTACNFISLCRYTHGWIFFIYVLLLIAVIVLVWICHSGMITAMNAAIGCTVAVGLVILGMFIHWYTQVKGIIPGCNFFPSVYVEVDIGANAGADATVDSDVSSGGKAGVRKARR